MNLKDIYEIMDKFEASSLAEMELTMEDVSVKFGKAVSAPVPVYSPVAAAPAVPDAPAPVPAAGNYIKAPLVGTFYKSASPGADPFVTVGKTVKKGETVCLLEAMKMINEVPAPCDCVIEKILIEDGALAEFDMPLFAIKEL